MKPPVVATCAVALGCGGAGGDGEELITGDVVVTMTMMELPPTVAIVPRSFP